MMIAFPDFNEPFNLHTDSSDYRLGSVLSQDDKPTVFFSLNLISTQLNYTDTDKELLGITESLKYTSSGTKSRSTLTTRT